MAVATDPMSLPAVRPPANPAPRVVAADAETALSELPAPAGVRPQKPAGRRAADEPAVPSLPGMAVATDPMSPPAVRPPANPAPRAVAAEATAKAREQVAQRPAADQAHGLMAMEQAAASPAPLARPVSAAAGAAAAPTAAAVTTNAGVTERVLTADSPLPVTGMDAGPVATPALAPAGVGVPAPAPAPAATVQVPEFSLAATPGSAQFGPQLGDRVLWLVHEGMHEARLQLNPRELGPVEVRLSVGDGAAQVSFSAQHAGTAAAVQQSLPQLRDLLAQQGLQLGQASVFHQPAGDGDAGRQQQAASGQSGWHGGGGQGPELDDTLPALPARLLGRGLVDAYA
jgi:flagellar hook-length control protein FliK